MFRFSLLAIGVLALAGSASDSYTFSQRGTVAAPRAAMHDGQPLRGPVQVEGHMATTRESAIDGAAGASAHPVLDSESGAAVARNQAGGAVRFRAGKGVDIGFEVDGSWEPTASTRDGGYIPQAPDDAAIDVALAVRGSTAAGDAGFRVGWVANIGTHSVPIRRGTDGGGAVQRDEAILFRAAIVPSLRRGALTLFGSLGAASETDVPAEVYVDGAGDDPGRVANTVGAALTVAAGARVDLGDRAHLTARVGDAFTDRGIASHYGPQVDVALGFELGE